MLSKTLQLCTKTPRTSMPKIKTSKRFCSSFVASLNPKQKAMYDWLEIQPKVDLHRHLEGSIPYRTLFKFFKHNSTHPSLRHLPPKFNSVEEIRHAVSLVTPMEDLAQVLDRLDVFQHAFVSINAVREITLAAILHAFQEESICKLEFRFSPQYMAEPYGLDWDQMMGAMLEARDAVEGVLGSDRIKIGFIAIASRNYGEGSALETAKFCEKWKRELVGFDLAASEDHFPPETFLSSIHKCRDIGLPITIHSGEGTSPEHIRRVVELYEPQRLGHATSLIQSPEMMQIIKDKQICVEACPTSNLITNCVKSYATHPLKKYLEFGIPVTVNTDDPMLFGTDLRKEWLHTMYHMDMTPREMIIMNEYAHRHSFIKD